MSATILTLDGKPFVPTDADEIARSLLDCRFPIPGNASIGTTIRTLEQRIATLSIAVELLLRGTVTNG